MDYVKLGKRVRYFRRIIKMTQEQLANEVGVSTSFIGLIERGKRVPSIDTVRRICNVLGASADHLLGLE